MIEENLITGTPQLAEAERLRKELRAANRKVWRAQTRRKIKRHCCQQCGLPKHYICLTHNQHKLRIESFVGKVVRKRRYYARKLFFTIAEKLGFIV